MKRLQTLQYKKVVMSKNTNDKTKQNKKHQMIYIPQKAFLTLLEQKDQLTGNP